MIEKAGVVECLVAPILAGVRSAGSLMATLIGSTVATNIVTADQYIAIMLPGRMFKNGFEQRNLAPVVMSRAPGDSALVRWNSCGAYMDVTLGVAAVSYAPFTFFNLLNPLVSIFFACAGIRMLNQQPQPPDLPPPPDHGGK